MATGACRPLSTEVPLLPVTDLLRRVRREHPTWFDSAMSQCPAYVRASLPQILPELAVEETAEVSEEWARQRLFIAVDALISALREQRPLALLVEDAHWADTTTLDLLELLGSHHCPTGRDGAHGRPRGRRRRSHDWLTRVRRLPGAASLALAPLTAHRDHPAARAPAWHRPRAGGGGADLRAQPGPAAVHRAARAASRRPTDAGLLADLLLTSTT